MALNFGILQPVNIGGQITAGRQEAQRNQLAQQQLQTGAMQQEKAQMEMADFRAKQAGLDKFLAMSQANGKTGTPEELASSFYDFALTQRDPQLILAAQTMRQAATERSAYNASRQPPKISPVGSAPDTFDFGQQNEPVLQPNVPGTAVSTPVRPMVNQLAPPPAAAAAPVNQLGTDTTAIENRINELRVKYPNLPDVQKEADRLEKRLEESRKLYTVGGNLVTGTGKPIFTAPKEITPSEIKRLTAERDALSPTDPNRKLYDQAIANLGSTERLAQERLNFDRQKFAWEKSNPGYTIQQSEDGSIVGVNNRTLQAFPVSLNATPPPVATPFGGGGARAPGGAGKRGGVVAPVAEPIIQPQGAPLIGKASGSTEGERKAATLLQRLQFSQNQLTQALTDDPKAAGPEAFAAAVGKLSTTAGNLLNSEARQRVEAAQLDILDAALTLGTGAAYTREQLEGYRQAYFPAYGDEPKTILDKQARLQNVIDAAQIASGKAGKLVPLQTPISGGSDIRSKADQILKRKP
jgi:hypothetical protein